MKNLVVTIHYACYDGIPLFSKWLTIKNKGTEPVMLNRFTSEVLAAVEAESWVESGKSKMPVPNIYVETDYAFHGMVPASVIPHSVFWEPDPEYRTQVSYRMQTPCLLKVRPEIGPAQIIRPGATFESFRTWELIQDSYDKERQTLAIRRMYRIIAPWVTENPIMMHVRYSDPQRVKIALDQCADVGFEMAILTFGSGFNPEREDTAYLNQIKELTGYAHEKGVEFGGYSLLSSRRISEEDDVINPETGKRGGVIHGNAPCLGSRWGIDYMRKLYHFFSVTGMDLLEHDGSYPGHICASTTHPGHRGMEDSQWTQWKIITDFYKWCRKNGIYLNVPDWYYLTGSNKNGMGYREVNWSLPRALQVIHTRQNIFDGTWYKTPSMGWMFVPLTQYHGGGAAATIEPLHEHLDHYGKMLAGNLGNGVQACYRGPRLYDTDSTRDLVKKWVDFYKKYRDILESDVIHNSSRRADGKDPDWIFHANPNLDIKGIALIFNPTSHPIEKNILLNLYYCNLGNRARIRLGDNGSWKTYRISRDHWVEIPVSVNAGATLPLFVKE
ncbi:MAG: hypothetical protein J7L89_03150 [Bacteroidales bacterium]|nr:hypothetical protein [Bacteroidales bacterium]